MNRELLNLYWELGKEICEKQEKANWGEGLMIFISICYFIIPGCDVIMVEYALENISSPLGVAEYQIMNSVPDNLKGDLPSIEELEEGLGESLEALIVE